MTNAETNSVIGRNEIINAIKKSFSGSGILEISDIFDALFDELIQSLERGDEININGFGKFCLITQKERVGRDVSSKKNIYKERTLVKFMPSKGLSACINKQ